MDYEDLPAAYRYLVKMRCIEDDIDDFTITQSRKEKIDSLSSGFIWVDTPEGNSFWEACATATSKENLPELPEDSKQSINKYKILALQDWVEDTYNIKVEVKVQLLDNDGFLFYPEITNLNIDTQKIIHTDIMASNRLEVLRKALLRVVTAK